MNEVPRARAPPPDCGKRLLPVVIDQIARDEPTRVWCSLPRDDYNLAAGYEDVTYVQFSNAINKLSWFIVSAIGKCASTAHPSTIAYLGVPDIRYHMMQMAACKTGYKVLFSSQFNSTEVHAKLMARTDCTTVFSAIGVRVSDVLAAARPGMKHAVIPELDDLLNVEHVADHFPFEKTFDEAKWDPYLILHSSGTTGDPKPLEINHAMIAAQDAQELPRQVPSGWKQPIAPSRLRPGRGERLLLTAPHFHAMSACYAMIGSVLRDAVFVPGFRHRSATPDDMLEILAHCEATQAILTPWMMDDVARAPNAKDYIEKLGEVSYCGAAISPLAASVWGKYTRAYNVWGATETLACVRLLPLRPVADSQSYVFFDTENGGYEFRRIQVAGYSAEDGNNSPTEEEEDLHELVLVLTEKSAPLATWHAGRGITLENTQPSRPEWETGDLWTPHPDSDLSTGAAVAWKFVCRKDDLITFSTATNTDPAQIHRALEDHDQARAALAVGNGHRQLLVLVEVADGCVADRETATRIWEEALAPLNARLPAHVRVALTHLVVVPAGSFVWTPKGSVAKRLTIEKFAALIDETYEKYGDRWSDERERYGSITATTNIKVQFTPETTEEEADGKP